LYLGIDIYIELKGMPLALNLDLDAASTEFGSGRDGGSYYFSKTLPSLHLGKCHLRIEIR